jgi:peptidoglycan/LPS O-acetylase OafA/YrhL
LSTKPSLCTPAPDTTTTPSSRTEKHSKQSSPFYRPELDVLRLFAFLCVFLTHGIEVNLKRGFFARYPFLAHAIDFLHRIGSYGLPLFFFLSSFLITTLLLLEKGKTGEVHLRSFYIRRILRIWPLYFGFITLAVLAGLLWPRLHFSVHALLGFFLLSGNWYVIAAGALPVTVTFLWSISVEEQFYLIWPTLVRRISPRGIQIFSLVLFVTSLVLIGVLAATHSVFINIWFNSAAQMLFFAGGALLALRVGLTAQQKSAWKCLLWLFTGIAFWIAADTLVGTTTEFATFAAPRAVPCYLCMCLGCASMLWAFLHMPSSWLWSKLVYLGRISYGLYVFQGVALILGREFVQPHMRGGAWLLFSLAFAILMAVPSYEFYEKPFLKLKQRFEFVHSRPA